VWRAIAGGLALGVASRVEETVDGFDVGISSNLAWLATAFAVGALVAEIEWSGLAGAVALTAANSSYYAWIATVEGSRELDGVAGAVEPWFALGVTGGFVFGAAGALARSDAWWTRAAACAPLAALTVAERVPALQPLLP
jgi:hypothetical protein